jgi:hypothetical protein
MMLPIAAATSRQRRLGTHIAKRQYVRQKKEGRQNTRPHSQSKTVSTQATSNLRVRTGHKRYAICNTPLFPLLEKQGIHEMMNGD